MEAGTQPGQTPAAQQTPFDVLCAKLEEFGVSEEARLLTMHAWIQMEAKMASDARHGTRSGTNSWLRIFAVFVAMALLCWWLMS